MNALVTRSHLTSTPAELERLRERLSRHYEIVAQTRQETLWRASPTSKTTTLQRLLRAMETQFLPHYLSNPPGWRKFVRRLSRNRTLPDFCIVGPPKCATSDLAISVLLHPNVIAPLAKEIQSPAPERWRLYYPTVGQKARHSNRYGLSLSPYLHPSLHWMEVPYTLARARPDAKIVIVLRGLIKRLYGSSAQFVGNFIGLSQCSLGTGRYQEARPQDAHVRSKPSVAGRWERRQRRCLRKSSIPVLVQRSIFALPSSVGMRVPQWRHLSISTR